MKIFCGEYEVYESGHVNSPDLSDTRFVISENPRMEIVFKIVFDNKKQEITGGVIEGGALAITFRNPDGLSVGPASPLKVGFLGGKEFYVSFRVTVRGDNDSYGLEYAFYTKEAK